MCVSSQVRLPAPAERAMMAESGTIVTDKIVSSKTRCNKNKNKSKSKNGSNNGKENGKQEQDSSKNFGSNNSSNNNSNSNKVLTRRRRSSASGVSQTSHPSHHPQVVVQHNYHDRSHDMPPPATPPFQAMMTSTTTTPNHVVVTSSSSSSSFSSSVSSSGGALQPLGSQKLESTTTTTLSAHSVPTTTSLNHYDWNLRSTSTTPFPLKLYEMLDQIDRNSQQPQGGEQQALVDETSIVSWQPHGRCFVIHNSKEFREILLPRYFPKLSKVTSFQRQLNLYGFQRITQGLDKGSYYHECFLRGKPYLAYEIQRIKVKGTGVRGKSNPDQEPDFWAMEWVGTTSTSTTENYQNTAVPPSRMLDKRAAIKTTQAADPVGSLVNDSRKNKKRKNNNIVEQGAFSLTDLMSSTFVDAKRNSLSSNAPQQSQQLRQANNAEYHSSWLASAMNDSISVISKNDVLDESIRKDDIWMEEEEREDDDEEEEEEVFTSWCRAQQEEEEHLVLPKDNTMLDNYNDDEVMESCKPSVTVSSSLSSSSLSSSHLKFSSTDVILTEWGMQFHVLDTLPDDIITMKNYRPKPNHVSSVTPPSSPNDEDKEQDTNHNYPYYHHSRDFVGDMDDQHYMEHVLDKMVQEYGDETGYQRDQHNRYIEEQNDHEDHEILGLLGSSFTAV